MRRAALFVGFLVVLAGVSAPVLALPHGEASDLPGDPAVAPALDPPETTLLVTLRTDRSARWTVVMRYSLPTEEDKRAFDRVASEFEDGNGSLVLDVGFFERVASGASTVADREMDIRDVERSADRDGEVGELRLSLTWTNFLGQRDAETLVLRDAFRSPDGGTWLSTLRGGQTLVVRTPEGYTISSTSTPLLQRNDSFIVRGPHQFDGDEPFEVVYRETEDTTPIQTSPTPDETDWELIVAAVIVLLSALIAAVAWRRRDGSAGATAEDDDTPDDGGEAAAPGTEPESEDEAGDGDEEDDAVDVELLSDEERVEHLLSEAGGRMRQADIVSETGWSDAKVSQLLSRMADEGRVEKLRLGRENLISLPGTDHDSDEE